MPTKYDIIALTLEELAGMSFLERHQLISNPASINNLIQQSLDMQELVLQANLPSASAISKEPGLEGKLFAAISMKEHANPVDAELMFRTIEAYILLQISKIEMCTNEQQLTEVINAFTTTLEGFNSSAPIIFHGNSAPQDFKRIKTSDIALQQTSNIILNYLKLYAAMRSLKITSTERLESQALLAYLHHLKLQDKTSMHFLDKLSIASAENFTYITTGFSMLSMNVVNAVNNNISTLPDKMTFIAKLSLKIPKIASHRINKAAADALFTEFLQRTSDEDIVSSINNPTPFETMLVLSIFNENLSDKDLKVDLYRILEAQCKAALENYDALIEASKSTSPPSDIFEELLININLQLVIFLEQINPLLLEYSNYDDEEDEDFYKEKLPSICETIKQVIAASINTMIHQLDFFNTPSMPPKTTIKISQEFTSLMEKYFAHLKDIEEEIPPHFIVGYKNVNEALVEFIINQSNRLPTKEVMLFNNATLESIKRYLNGLNQDSVKTNHFVAFKLGKYKILLSALHDMMHTPGSLSFQQTSGSYNPAILEDLLSSLDKLQTKSYRRSNKSLKL